MTMCKSSNTKATLPEPLPTPDLQASGRQSGDSAQRPPFVVLSGRNLILICTLLFILVAGTFLPAVSNGFIDMDDVVYVTQNAQVQAGLTRNAFVWAFTTLHFGNWCPMTWLSHMLDCQLFGLEPWGHHLTSVLLHALNAVLVFLVLRRMTGATWRSLFVAALFGLHPLRVESVAWVSGRKDVLSTLFFLLALWAYSYYAESVHATKRRENEPVARNATWISRTFGFYMLTLLFFMFALMSKPMVVTLPFVLLLLDWWPLNRIRLTWSELREKGWALLREKLPFFALASIFSVVTYYAQGTVVLDQAATSLTLRFGNASVSYVRYITKTLWPNDLAAFYPFPNSLSTRQVVNTATFLLAVTVAVIAWRRRPWLAVGWFWYLGTLLPVIQLVKLASHAMADRFSYIPHIGLFVGLVWGADNLAKRWDHRVLASAATALLLLCVLLTRTQISYWKDSETLFRHTIAVTHKNYIGHNNLAAALHSKGNLDEAISQFREALAAKPDYIEAHNNLGVVLQSKGNLDEAISAFQEALRLKPDYADAHYNLGNALYKKGQLDEAMSQYGAAIKLKPDYTQAHYNLGVVLHSKGNLDEAISQFREVLAAKPDYVEAHNNLGVVLLQKGRLDEAISRFNEALRLKPDYADARKNLDALLNRNPVVIKLDSPEAYNNLGIALASKGKLDEAISAFQEALRLKPDYAQAHYNLGNALNEKGQLDEAMSQYEEAIKLKPDYAQAHYNLATALLCKGDLDESIAHSQEAVRLEPDDAEVHNNLGVALGRKGRLDEAISRFQEALRLKPDYADARNNLDAVRNMKSAPTEQPVPAPKP